MCALPATDNFNGTTGTALATYSASWTVNNGAFAIQSNAVGSAAGGAIEGSARWNADTFNNNQYSQGTVLTPTALLYIGVTVRVSTSGATTWYLYEVSSADRFLYKAVAGTLTELGTTPTGASANDVLRLEANGTTITPKRNGTTDTQVGAVTDSAIASGSAGIGGYNTAGTTDTRLDNWEGGNLTRIKDMIESGGVMPKRR